MLMPCSYVYPGYSDTGALYLEMMKATVAVTVNAMRCVAGFYSAASFVWEWISSPRQAEPLLTVV
jgi:hypothetical protein